jgi:hypothetical protein
VLIEEVLESHARALRAAPVVRGNIFANIGQWLDNRTNLSNPGCPENPVVVLGVATGQVLVIRSRLGEGISPHDKRRRVEFLDAVAKE